MEIKPFKTIYTKKERKNKKRA